MNGSGNNKKSSSQKNINDPAECQQNDESKNAAIINSVKSSFKTSQHVIDEYTHPNNATNNNNVRLPRTYGDLLAKYIVAIRKDKTCTG